MGPRYQAGDGEEEVIPPKPRNLKPIDNEEESEEKPVAIKSSLKSGLKPTPPPGKKPEGSPARRVKKASEDSDAEGEGDDKFNAEAEAKMAKTEKKQQQDTERKSRFESRKSLAGALLGGLIHKDLGPGRQYTDILYAKAEQKLLWRKLDMAPDDDEVEEKKPQRKGLQFGANDSVEFEDENAPAGGKEKVSASDKAAKVRRQSAFILSPMDLMGDLGGDGGEEPGTGGSGGDQDSGGEEPGPGEAPEVADKAPVNRGPHPLKDLLTAKKIKVDAVKKALEELKSNPNDLAYWLEAPLDPSGVPPKPLGVAIAEGNPGLVEMLVNDFNVDVTTPFAHTSMYKGWVKPGVPFVESVVSRKGRFVGTMLADKLGKIEEMLKAGAEKQAAEKAAREAGGDSGGTATTGGDAGGSAEPEEQKEAIPHTQGHPKQTYEVMEHVGDGDTSTVWGGWHLGTKLSVAIKAEAKSDEAGIWDEIALLKTFQCDKLVKLYETFENEAQVFMVLELCQGGRLYDSVGVAGSGTESIVDRDGVRSPKLFKQMASAVSYLHENSIAHRDIQLENFLIYNSPTNIADAVLKLIDFTTAKEYSDGNELITKVCTPMYVAREILSRRMEVYTEKVDIWSLGVTYFIMLCGHPPFAGESDMDILKKVKRGTWKFEPKKAWRDVDEQACDLVTNMIQMKAEDRLSAQEVLKSSYLKDAEC
eukprot:TRINITY_DN19456_c0_g2_i1.p1 TRINITY_DN19456_c0_g2~~TRINITY_DN19456_c0_g2_i1.p1  ORF type:complete len:702 (-),score=166.74 TRINITY_DN19456_c0_g2_i1:316-2421(-)